MDVALPHPAVVRPLVSPLRGATRCPCCTARAVAIGLDLQSFAAAGLVVCCVGYFFTLTILYIAQVITYRLLWQDGEEHANEEQFVRFGRDDLYV